MGSTTTLLDGSFIDKILDYKYNNLIGFKFYSTERNNDGVEFIENFLIVNDGSPYLESLYRHIHVPEEYMREKFHKEDNKYLVFNYRCVTTFLNDQDLKDTGFFIMTMTELEFFYKKLDIFNLENNFRKKYGHKLYNKTRSHGNENRVYGKI